MTTGLIVEVDESFESQLGKPPAMSRQLAKNIVTGLARDFDGIQDRIQIKVNTIARVLGHECLEILEKAGFEIFLDGKYGSDELETLLADMRALSGFKNLRRITFRVECPVDFLTGRSGVAGAQEILPNVSFLPVGPVTDLVDGYFRVRYGSDREGEIYSFGNDVHSHFSDRVTEIICGPSDIAHFPHGFWRDIECPRSPIVPISLLGDVDHENSPFFVENAVKAGASAIILGNPIMSHEDRGAAAKLVLDYLAAADQRHRSSC